MAARSQANLFRAATPSEHQRGGRHVLAGGWPVSCVAPPGDDVVLRSLFPDQRDYAAIFDELRPVIWKMVRT
jgi:hypothetical protein